MSLPTPYFDDGNGIVIYHGDCRSILPSLAAAAVDLVLTDPPYGIDLDTDYANGKHRDGTIHDRIAGDSEPFDPSHLLTFKRLILWGANCYADKLPPSPVWLSWDKVTQNGLNLRIAEHELAWTNCISRPRVFRHMWSGGYRASERSTAYHPSQKPVALMQWCLSLVKNTSSVLDPYMGSGPVLEAAKRLGHRAIGIELSERYCEIAARRLSQEVLQLW
jgi:DNA modification methylase